MILSASTARRLLAALYLLIVLVCTWQRGIASRSHSTFAIFRQSYAHLVAGKDIYARYPDEQGIEPPDRFKYSPTAAVFLAPLSALPYPVALFLWDLLNAGLLFYAVGRSLPGRTGNLALLALAPEVFVAVQASSSNALVAGLMLLAAGWIVSGRHARAAVAVGIGTAIKIFPIAIATLAISRDRRWRVVGLLVGVGVVLAALPLLVIPVGDLVRQYRWWHLLELSDAHDLEFGASLIRSLRSAWPTTLPNVVFQAAGALLLLAPLARRDQWANPRFLRRLGCSVLVFCVLFNHQAERQAFVIAATGAVIWIIERPRSPALLAVLALALTGVSIVPYGVLWLSMQFDLLADAPPAVPASAMAREGTSWRAAWAAACGACGAELRVRSLTCSSCGTTALSALLHRMPEVLALLLLALTVADAVTPGHLLLPRNLWDLAR